MGGRLDATTEKKLDMALDDLVDKRKEQDPESDEDRRPPHKERHEQSGPYSRGDGKGRGQSGKKGPYRKVPLEEKALLHTDCFFNADGDFVVKLYDTEVFILKKRPEALDVDGKPSAGSPPPGVVLVLTSGKYRTIETKYIINEALQSFSMRVSEGDDSNWTVVGESTSQPFEDGMQVQVTAPLVRASVVKQHLADKIQDAKSRGAARADPATRGHHRRGGDYEPHMPPAPPGHWAPPPAHHPHRPPDWPHPHHAVGPPPMGPPPPGWGPPPMHPGWTPHHMPPWNAGHGPHRRPPPQISNGGGPPAAVRTEPLPDEMFQ